MAERAITVGGLAFGQVDGIVKTDAAVACHCASFGHHIIEAIRTIHFVTEQRAAHDRTGIDHRVMRQALRIERQFVESQTRRFASYMGMDFIAA